MKARENIGLLQTTPVFIGTGGSLQGNIGDFTPNFTFAGGILVDDILLFVVENDSASTVPAAPAGYASVLNSPQTDAGSRLSVFWKRATAAESAPTIADTGDHQAGAVLLFRGCVNSGNPWDVTAGSNSNGTSISCPTVTTTGPLRLIVAIASTGLDANSTTEFSAWANANLVSVTEILDGVDSSGNGGGVGAAVGVKVNTGATGATTATAANSSPHGLLTIALKGFGP